MADRMPYAIGGVLGGMLLIVVVQAFLPEGALPSPVPTQETECVGEPIVVDYDFGGTFMEPHECAIQCQDGNPRYILYANGKATQCETPPGCNDYGEDRGITCKVPAS